MEILLVFFKKKSVVVYKQVWVFYEAYGVVVSTYFGKSERTEF